MTRVAIVGLGAVSALGEGVEALWSGLCAGRSGLDPAGILGAPGPVARCAGGRTTSTLAWDAAREALDDAGNPPGEGLAVVAATTSGDMTRGEAALERLLAGREPGPPGELTWIQLAGRLSRELAHRVGATGPALAVSSACTSGAAAIALGADLVAAGLVPRALVVGADALCRTTVHGFHALGAHARGPCRPFDRDRQGMNLGEGAGALLLEDALAARDRGARIRACLVGHGSAADAHHLTAPHPEGRGLAAAIRRAVGDGPTPEHVQAHGTGTPLNDAMEARVFRALLPDAVVGAVKGAIGHALGAAGALEAIVAVRTLESGLVPPVVGLRDPLPDLDLPRGSPRRAAIRRALSVNAAFGGHNVALLLEAAT